MFLFFYPNVYPKTTSHTHSIHNLFTVHKYLNIMQLHIFVYFFFLKSFMRKKKSLNQIFTWRSCLAASAPARVLNVTKPTGYVKKMKKKIHENRFSSFVFVLIKNLCKTYWISFFFYFKSFIWLKTWGKIYMYMLFHFMYNIWKLTDAVFPFLLVTFNKEPSYPWKKM